MKKKKASRKRKRYLSDASREWLEQQRENEKQRKQRLKMAAEGKLFFR